MNRNSIRYQIKDKGLFIIAMCLNVALLIYAKNMLEEWRFAGRENIINALLLCIGKGPACWIGLLFPVVAALPFSTTYVREKKTGFYTCAVMRKGFKQYIAEKIVKSLLLGGITLALPVTLLTIYLKIEKDSAASLYDIDQHTTASFLTGIAEKNPNAYLIMTILIVFICGAVFSVFALGISAWVKNEFLTLVIPFAVCILSAIFFDNFNLLLTFCPSEYDYVRVWHIVVMDVAIFLTGITLFIMGVIKNKK